MSLISFVSFLSFVLCIQGLPLQRRTTFSGHGTYYYNVGLGSCGTANQDNLNVAALSPDLMKSGEYCGKSIKVTSNGKSVMATVADTCDSCGKTDVDLSVAAFRQIANLDLGRVPVQWKFT
ncbi:hypothetical protein EC973_006509 [Apophysomyces ossiformis]|uniref:RlpA-like protein double-psi beta-barrel domain-containing protein n=1 Tax=Apophysomyces ossiformis TaxID=679940 RepID=A0A8H7ESB3_9FUNG|nr:hypothetical protein EC973_006509 [Apophysomyces ossiformis]